jgi:hypothetical protein
MLRLHAAPPSEEMKERKGQAEERKKNSRPQRYR